MSRKEIIDKYLNLTVSKTLMITLIATAALFLDKLDGTNWTFISIAYIGAEKVTQTIIKLQQSKLDSENNGGNIVNNFNRKDIPNEDRI